MSQIETKQETLDRITSIVSNLDPEIDTLPGEFVNDCVLVPLAEETWAIRVMNDYAQKIQSLLGFSYILNSENYRENLRIALGINPATGRAWTEREVNFKISQDLDKRVGDWGIVRRPAQRAVGTCHFFFDSGASVEIPIGTKVWTGEGLYFRVSQTVEGEPVYNSVYNKYLLEAPIVAEKAGAGGNILSSKIKFCDSVKGLSFCRNLSPTSGGADMESDIELVVRAQNAWKGRNLFTKAGIKKYFEGKYQKKYQVKEALVVGPGDSLMKRKRSGAIDVYVISRIESTHIEYVTYKGAFINLKYMPLINFTSARYWSPGVTPGGPGSVELVKDVDYRIETLNGETRRSVYEVSRWVPILGKEPPEGSTLEFVYTSNSAIRDLWQDMALDELEIAGDLLIKEGVYRGLYINWHIDFLPGNETNIRNLQSRITDIVGAYFTGNSAYGFAHKGFGAVIEASDLVDSLYDLVPEISHITLPFVLFYVEGQEPGYYDVITLGRNEYCRLEEITFS